MRVALLVTHLLGTGHLSRAVQIADALTEHGHDVALLSGGMPAPHLSPKAARVVQLPPVRANGPSFSGLIDAEGAEVTDVLLTQRKTLIAAVLQAYRLDALIVELFPFGRRKLAAEFETAIAAAKPAKIICSIRDILEQPSKSERIAEAEARALTLFDRVLVHGDAALAPLEASWPVSDALAKKLSYTGYIAAPLPDQPSVDGAGEILVAAGGGPVGRALFNAAAAASVGSSYHWRLLVGGADREAVSSELQSIGGANLTAEPVRPDFRGMLGHAALLVAQCGYNTAMDVAMSGVRALFVPFEEGGAREQLARAKAMRDRFGVAMLREADLSPAALSAAISQAMAAPPPNFQGVATDGAGQSVKFIEAML